MYEWKPSLVNRSCCLLLLSSHNEVQIGKFWGIGTSYILTALHCIDFLTYSCVLIVTFRNFLRISCFGQKNKNHSWECLFQCQEFLVAKQGIPSKQNLQSQEVCVFGKGRMYFILPIMLLHYIVL